MKKNKIKFKVLLIIEHNTFFISEFISKFLQIKSNKYIINHAFIVKKVNSDQNINFYMIKNFFFLTFKEKIIFLKKIIIRKIVTLNKPKKYDLKKIIKSHNIKVTEINDRLSKYKKLIKEIKPSLIVNSASLYVREDILKIPRFGCVNRHSSMLPAGGGFFPIFYAITYKEPIGTTVHFMSKNIDKGMPVIQKQIRINKKNNTVFKLYEQSFIDSPMLINKAINLVMNKRKFKINKSIKPSYRSFPKKKDWEEFRKKNIPWI
jgi:methionyl-tRNA formyltransferase